MSNKEEKEKKIRSNRKTINSFGVSEEELKNSIIQYENLPPSVRGSLEQRGSLILEDIINKIDGVIKQINDERLQKANLSNLGTTLKSLVQAFHFLELHFHFNNEKPIQISENPDDILEQTSEIVFRTKKKWEKGK